MKKNSKQERLTKQCCQKKNIVGGLFRIQASGIVQESELEASMTIQSSHASRVIVEREGSIDPDSLEPVSSSEPVALCLYSFLQAWFGRRVQSFHHKLTACSEEKSSGGGPSTLRSSRVLSFRLVRRSVLIMFMIEKALSTVLLVKGRLNNSSLSKITVGHFRASGAVKILYHTFL